MSEPSLPGLRSLPGVTSALAAAIAARYPDVERLRAATVDDLRTIPDVTADVANRILGLAPATYGCPMCGARYTSAELSELPAVDTRRVLGAEDSSCVHCGAYLFDGAAAVLICGHAAGPTEG